MVIGGLSKLTGFLRSNGVSIPWDRTCTVGAKYRLADGRCVEVVKAPAGSFAKAYGYKCNRFELREVAA